MAILYVKSYVSIRQTEKKNNITQQRPMHEFNVLQDLPDGTALKCVTQHPGFNVIYLEKWNRDPRMATERLKTKLNNRPTYVPTDWFLGKAR